MPEHPDSDSMADPITNPPNDDGLTRSYLPPQADRAEVSIGERATQLRLTGGAEQAEKPERDDVPLSLAGRYAIVRELGRGGMGVVLEADDPELRRHLAIKVLLQRHQHDDALVRRFLDEARICAQLQHPGIVPIHEIGRLPDQRPFFTMKLIQGQTLAALLQARRNAEEDPARFLTIFEQVCLTMAYAHSHGVLHRDLKPSNVMVGNFGEVQVMDWGLAKVLTPADGSSELSQTAPAPLDLPHPAGDAATSLAGTIMGTPGYMAPEQARGASSAIDARADVFGLGGILCAILTGKPPYDGSTYPQVYRQAVEADLSGAYARLSASKADAELIRLAQRCLAAEPKDRPCDAGIVALSMTNYRASVAERLHAAELARAAAQVKAAGERKARRLTLALATAALALFLLIGGGWFWLDYEWNQRRQLLASRIEERIQQALRLRAKGQDAPAAELTPWIEALDNVHAAMQSVRAEAVDPALRQRLSDLASELETELRDRRMLARLEEIRLKQSQAKNLDPRSAADQYAAAFRDYDIAVDRLSSEQAAEAIRGRAIAVELAAALDDWAEASGDLALRKRLLEAALRADGDPWRQRLRAALIELDRDALADAARSAEVDNLPPVTLYLLGQALANVRDSVESIRLLRRAQHLHPDDFWINFRLALQLEIAKPPRANEAVRFYSAALAVRKQSAAAHLSLAVALHDNKALDESIAQYREALRLQNDFVLAHYNLGNALRDKGQMDEAIAEYRETIRLQPNYVEAYTNLGGLLVELGQLEEGGDALRKAIELQPSHASAHHNLALTLMRLGRLEEAVAACEEAVKHKGNAGYHNTLGVLLEKTNRRTDAVAAYKKAIELDNTYAAPHANLSALYLRLGETKKGQAEAQEALRLRPADVSAQFALGAALLTQGEYEKAIAAFRKVVKIEAKNSKAWVNLGTALAHNGQVDESIAAYQEALRLEPKFLAAWLGLGASHQHKGDLNAAIDAYRKGVEAAKSDAEAHNSLGIALGQRGRLAEAVRSFREAIRLQPNFARAYHNLGNALGSQGEFAAAVQAFDKAIALKPDYFVAIWNRGQLLQDWGKLDDAIAAFRDALKINPEDAWVTCLLGLALQERGRLRQAREALQQGHEWGVRQKGWNKSSASWLHDIQRQIERDKKLPAIRRGDDKPADNDERLGMALLCMQAHAYYADAVRLFREGFAERPASAEKYRHQAACAAALAACDRSEEANKRTEAECAGWRKQAREWLQVDLELLKKRSERGSESLRGEVRKFLERWKNEPDLASLRDAKALDALPKEEGEAWRRFWDEVNKVLDATAPASGGRQPPVEGKTGG